MLKTPICATCGCSLVRLGIMRDKATFYRFKGKLHTFCCQGCVELFIINPDHLLKETADMRVCPVCLAEKQMSSTVVQEYNGSRFYFCRCPHCLDLFKQRPVYFIKRLTWQTDYSGVFSNDECCRQSL